jgi:hypothetical protein
MKLSFKMYAAAVSMAQTESKGSGNLNHFDEVANELHETGFDESYEELTPEERSQFVREFSEDILQAAKAFQKA